MNAPFQPKAAEESARVLSNAAVNGEYRHMVVACSPLAASISWLK